MHKFKLTIEYDGTNYSGWQRQTNAKSIQDTLTKTAEKLLNTDVVIQGAGRTDAGVHALAQVAHLATPKTVHLISRQILEGMNDLLPANINILKVEEVPADFHARHDAVMRSYIYLLSKKRTAFGKKYVWWVKDSLDIKKMRDIMALFRGFHDFASFADKRRDKEISTTVQLHSLELQQSDDLIIFRIVGSHFLWKMVRRMMGILVEAGRGNLARLEIEKMLTHASDIPAKFTAPPSGLFLEQVLYKGDKLKPPRLPLPLFL
ncbi:MAG: tRNA pseudouridine(38-40) synthase TruA [Syntrophales bacterium]|nr:tRNA pseudouridine(38-40) synthase TruA [Syntrophales bacterium]